MNRDESAVHSLISGVSSESWKSELEKVSSKFHITAAWIAVLFDPIFAITDFINIPVHWKQLLVIRLSISLITLILLGLRKRRRLPSYLIVGVPFLLISIQNAYTYNLIGNEDILGHNLNYIALLVGGGMFILWNRAYSIAVIGVSALATFIFMQLNAGLDVHQFFVQGGLLLAVVGIFMIVMIGTRYTLTVKEIKTRLALRTSNQEIKAQAALIGSINENLEEMVRLRTRELETKNSALEEYAFINAHKLRGPVASILGLVNLMGKMELTDETKTVVKHLQDSAGKLDAIVTDITVAIEKGERKN
jgi:signal transduction histidine kinase